MRSLLIAIWSLAFVSANTALADASPHYDEALLSKPTYKVRVEMNVPVAMRDGIAVSADIYRPDAEGRFPAILYRTPYSNNTEQAIAVSKWFAERGYVFLYQDVRGKFDSQGDFYPFRHEPDDGYDMDEWIGQQPWFSGKLGTMGGSYAGYTQWGQALRGSKYLQAMAPQFTTPDIHSNWFYIDGAFNYAFALSWGAIMIDGQVSQSTGNAVDMNATYRTLPIAAAPMTAGHRAAHYRDWISHPTRDAYWNDISYENSYDKIDVPMLSVGGWYDIFLRGTLQDDIEVRRQGGATARAGKRMMIGPWLHGASTRNNAGPGQPVRTDAVDFGSQADVDLQKLYLRWFDYWLKGIDNGVRDEPPIKLFVMGDNVWRDESEWPLKRARPTKYFLSSAGAANTADGNGRLSTQLPAAGTAATDSYVYDPNDPVPTVGGTSCCAALTSVGPMDQRPVEKRKDVLVFTTEPLKEAVEVTGPVTLTLYASTTSRDTDWTAKLVDVSPDGFARNVQEGILRARYRETRGKQPGTLLEPGKVYEYRIDLWSASNAFLPGHRIRLEVSSSNFPHFDRNLNTGEDPASSARVEVATQTIHHSKQYPSHLLLPIVPRKPAVLSKSVLKPPKVADLSGQIMTVRGPIPAERLGQTLMHEHVFIDFTVPDDEPARWKIAGRTPPRDAEAQKLYDAPLTMGILSTVLHGAPNRDNWRLDDERTAIKELTDFKQHGGAAIVDVSSIGLKRNPLGLRRVSEATGLDVVMGSSWYTEAWYSQDLAERTIEDLTAQIVRDLTVGVDGTDVRAGIIGEVGTSGTPEGPIESKIIRASGRASKLTGAAVTLHTLGFFKKHSVVLDMLAAEGADLSRVILGHSDFLANDTEYLKSLMQRGATVQFDLIGKPALLTRTRAADPQVAEAIVELIKAGFADRILLSHDICTKTSLKSYGGTGYAFILERFVPYLRQRGTTEEQIATMLVDNPRRLLSFVAPRTAS
jgi:putative CocE/NonD family hydrolase